MRYPAGLPEVVGQRRDAIRAPVTLGIQGGLVARLANGGAHGSATLPRRTIEPLHRQWGSALGVNRLEGHCCGADEFQHAGGGEQLE